MTSDFHGWEGGKNNVVWRDLLNQWLPRMSPSLQMWPNAITQLGVGGHEALESVWLIWLNR